MKRLPLITVVAAIIVLDQVTKILAREHLAAPRRLLGGLVTLIQTENAGAFLSLGANAPPFVRTIVFGVFVAVTLAAAGYALATGRVRRSEAYAVALVVAGGIGNLIDRVMREGRVTDFLYMEAGPLHTGVFNVADMAITLGVIWLFVASLKPRRGSAGGPPAGPPPARWRDR